MPDASRRRTVRLSRALDDELNQQADATGLSLQEVMVRRLEGA